ncbi:hypothetical protein K4K48_001914 [Colletotrichum sp. SAR 10_66]|nr:hypothetical protein K4K51_008538 [Colletotrichum sp. SAR 10_75]KAJ5001063.1 hypothetical protein K4K48_001914 [Colletotrichum sp. SAR 10_66]
MKGPAVSATAIYRPLATEDPTIHNLSPTVQEAQDLWHSDTFEDEMDSKQEEKFEYAKRLFKARIKYQKLFDEYRGNIVHGSSTLDESYYHFGDDDDSTREKERRNTSQVTTDIWGDEEDLASYWLLIRVNQLWMWTIGNKEHGQAEKFDYEKLAKANIKSDLLSTRAKDVLDELGILDATAQYQQDVQRAMMRSHVEAKSASEDLLWTDLSATHVINDIKRLNNIAERALASFQ